MEILGEGLGSAILPEFPAAARGRSL